MWMMGYNETHEDHHLNMNMNMNMNMVESYTNNSTRKLRPLAPKPPAPSFATSSSNRFPSTHLDHLLPISHHLVAAEHNKREFNSQQMVVVSSRWNPTPEQLQTLEELYRRGTRTPSADEIQHITAQLRRFGKIEGKNVFYWFQNHKARERQKRRRQLDKPTNDLHQPPFFTTDNNINTVHLDQSVPRKDSGFEETKNWAIRTFSEKNILREKQDEYRMTNVAGDHHEAWEHHQQQYHQQQDNYEDGNDDNDLLLIQRRRKNNPTRNATWHDMMQSLSCSSSDAAPLTNNHITLINNNSIKTSLTNNDNVDSYQTLQLFPVNNSCMEQPDKCFIPASDVCLSPRQFIEFLPLKK